MNMIDSIKGYLRNKMVPATEQPVVEAYDAWAGSYDYQPGNLMLDLDERLFKRLVGDIDLKNKRVADIGCGTGRHWQQLYALQPNLVMGFDVSGGMLQQLKNKFPGALTQQITGNTLPMVGDATVDTVISTITIAHIKHIEEAIASWVRITKKNGWLVITDFHPAMLANGGKRSFTHNGSTRSIVNYVHTLEKLMMLFDKYGCTLTRQVEIYVDEAVKHYYEAKNALPVYQRFKGMPIIYGLQLTKDHAAE